MKLDPWITTALTAFGAVSLISLVADGPRAITYTALTGTIVILLLIISKSNKVDK